MPLQKELPLEESPLSDLPDMLRRGDTEGINKLSEKLGNPANETVDEIRQRLLYSQSERDDDESNEYCDRCSSIRTIRGEGILKCLCPDD